MNETYLVPEARKKVLLLADDLRYPSGIGTMSKEIVLGTAGYFNWVQVAAGINHHEAGKVVDISKMVNEETGLSDSSVILYPNNGYGNMQLVRELMNKEHPDAIFIFTDPRYWIWLFQAERELRTQVPIIYLNIWDDLPYPIWNKPYYESCDGLFAISKQTYNINKVVLGEEAKNKVIGYIPHGVSTQFKPVDPEDSDLKAFKQKVFGSIEPEFTLLYNARNLGRKRVSDIILAWNDFCKHIGRSKATKCHLLMHTDIVDNAGTDLGAVYKDLCEPWVNVTFITQKLTTKELNYLYNLSDGVILISSNEGWGLSLTEAIMAGKMIIANVSGGMQDQMRFADNNGNWINFTKTFPSNHTKMFKSHGEWAIPIFPVSRSLCGSPTTPYIFDDRVAIEDIADAIHSLYALSPGERQRKGMLGRDWALSKEAGFSAPQMCNRIIRGINKVFENFKKHPRSNFEITEVLDRPSNLVEGYDPITYSYNATSVQDLSNCL